MLKYLKIIILSLFIYNVYAQDESILPAQKNAIQTLAKEQGFSDEDLNNYIFKEYGININDLTKNQAISIIKSFQNNNPPQPQLHQPTLAEILEVGMSKQFYITDGNVIQGEIVEISDQLCHIKTTEGLLKIPIKDILEETIDLIKISGSRYKGPLITEDEESMIIRSNYGDVIIYKKDIEKMDRYHGGKLIPWIENKKNFYEGEITLTNVFLDPTAFPLAPNTFYFSGLSIGYGFTDRFMITTKFGSNFNGDLNLEPKMRFWHKKTANREQALSWVLSLHRAYSIDQVISNYSHVWELYLNENNEGQLNELNFDDTEDVGNYINNFIDKSETSVLVTGSLLYSTRRKNPTGRGKVGWSLGLSTSNMLLLMEEQYNHKTDFTKQIKFNPNDELIYKIPFRVWANFEYDLQKNLKFLGSMWLDNSNRAVTFVDAVDDYTGNDGTDAFSFDTLVGKENLFDFDFGFQYAINNNFRLGVHFQQPYIDIYWEFFEF